jgi:hypothetical protein
LRKPEGEGGRGTRRGGGEGEAVDQAGGKAKKKLNSKGKAKVKAEVTYTPTAAPRTPREKKTKLVKR